MLPSLGAQLKPHESLAVPLRFIVADDEQSISSFIKRVIIRIYPDSVVTTVATGKAALHVYQQHGADLIITDHYMPEMDGLELISAIRAQNVALPILLVSAAFDSTAIIADVPKTKFLEKPIILSEFMAILTLLLEL